MAKGMKLKDSLKRYKGVDHKQEHQKRQVKNAEKRKRARSDKDDVEEPVTTTADSKVAKSSKPSKRQKTNDGAKIDTAEIEKIMADAGSDSEEWNTAEEDEGQDGVDGSGLAEDDDDDSDSALEFDQDGAQAVDAESDDDNDDDEEADEEEDEEDEGEEEEDDIALSDLESLASEDKGDIIPHQRLTINNKAALLKAYRSIALPTDLPFTANQMLVTTEPVEIKDVDDDLSRELAFYKQALDAVTRARSLLKSENAPFSRPTDYFAEMVKSEEHMGKIKSKLVGEAASKKAAAEARKQRDLKKFGKQVQIAKLQERDRTKRETLDKIKMLKKSGFCDIKTFSSFCADPSLERSGAEIANENEDSMFDVALDEAGADGAKSRRSGDRKPKMARSKRDEKFGFGGKKRFNKSNDAKSTADTSSFSQKRMKAGKTSSRPGKSKRAKMH